MDRLAELVHDELADLDVLRAVAYFEPDNLGAEYVRDDVRAQFTSAEDVGILKDALLDSMAADLYEEQFKESLHATTRIFETKYVAFFHLGATKGILVSLDRDGTLEPVVERVERTIAERTERTLSATP